MKVTYKFLQYGIVDELLGVFTTPRSPTVRTEAAKLICKLSTHGIYILPHFVNPVGEVVQELMELGALDILRAHADNSNIYVLYTIANMSQYRMFSE